MIARVSARHVIGWIPAGFAWLALLGFMLGVSLLIAYVALASGRLMLLGVSGIVGLLTILIIVPNERLGPYVVFGALPITGWAFKQSTGSGFNFLADALIVVAFAAVLLNRKQGRPPRSLTVPLVLLFIIGLIEILNPNLSSGGIAGAVYGIRDSLLPILLFFVAFYTFRSSRQVEWFLLFVMVIAAVNGLWAIKQIEVGLDSGEASWAGVVQTPAFYVQNQLRAFSTFDAPWGYAYYTDITIALGVGLLMGSRSWFIRAVTLVALVCTSAGLYLSLVRTALAMVPIAVLLMLFLRFRGGLRVPLVAVSVALALALLGAMVTTSLPSGKPNLSPMGRYLSDLNLFQDPSMRDRFYEWSYFALPAALENPLGKGLGTTGGVGAQYNSADAITTDNTYLTFAIEFGWVGLVLYLFLLTAALVLGLHLHAREHDRTRGWILASLVAVIALTFMSDFFNVYSTGDNGRYLYFLLGLLAYLGTAHRGYDTQREGMS